MGGEVAVNPRDRVELAIWVLLLVLAVAAVGQRPAPPPGEVLRRIDDPAAGGAWLLVRDPVHRAGPGRLIWVPRGAQAVPGKRDAGLLAEDAAYRPVILAGDLLVVEEETAVAEVRLAATALEPAPAGGLFNARLEIGGKVVRAIAVGPNRARFAPETAAQP